MHNYQIRPYEADHALAILSQGYTESFSDTDQARLMENSKFSVTLLIDDDPVVCSGIIKLWDGVGEGWFLSTDEVSKSSMVIARATKEVLLEEISAGNYWRLQINVRADWKQALRFAQFLGFEEEGLMHKFGPDQKDYLRMAIVK